MTVGHFNPLILGDTRMGPLDRKGSGTDASCKSYTAYLDFCKYIEERNQYGVLRLESMIPA